jgi:chromosome segregation protein
VEGQGGSAHDRTPLRRTAPRALLARADRCRACSAASPPLLTVAPGHEAALAAALGVLADAVAVATIDGAVTAVELLKREDAGRAALLVASAETGGGVTVDRPPLPEGASWALDLVRCPDEVRPALVRGLVDVVFAPDIATARRIVSYAPTLRAVTPDGDVFGAYAAAGGSGKQPSTIEIQAAVDEAMTRRIEAEHQVGALRAELAEARESVGDAKERLDAAVAAKRAVESERNAAARRLAELGAAARSALAETERLGTGRAKADALRSSGLEHLAELAERLRLAEQTPLDDDPVTDERDRLAAAVPQARQQEMEVRLAVRTAEEVGARRPGRRAGPAGRRRAGGRAGRREAGDQGAGRRHRPRRRGGRRARAGPADRLDRGGDGPARRAGPGPYRA